MANELGSAILSQLGALAGAPGTVPCTGLNRSDPSTPIEIEYAGSSVDTYNWGFSYNSAVAAGTNAGTATALTRQCNIVTGADGTTGVILGNLTVLNYAHFVLIYNADASSTLKVYPGATHPDTINGTTVLLIPPKCIAIIWPIAANAWYAPFNFPATLRVGAAQAAVDATGATQTTPFGYSEVQANAIVTLINELRAWAISTGSFKGAA